MKIKHLALILILSGANLLAQDFLGALMYNTAMPMGNTKDFISDYSWKGFSFEGRSFTNRNWSFGGSFGWNIFDQKLYETVDIEEENLGTTVTGTQIRYTNSFPLLLTGHYHFGKRRDSFRPFIGAGIGTYYILQRFEIGVYQWEVSNWHFGVAPEIGTLLALSRTTSLMISVKYNYAFSAGKTVYGSTDNTQSYLGVNIGLAFFGY